MIFPIGVSERVSTTVCRAPSEFRRASCRCVTFNSHISFWYQRIGELKPHFSVCIERVFRLRENSRPSPNIKAETLQRMRCRRSGQGVELRVRIARVARSLDYQRRKTRSTRRGGSGSDDGGLSGRAKRKLAQRIVGCRRCHRGQERVFCVEQLARPSLVSR